MQEKNLLYHCKLTKKFLFGLKEGLFVRSGVTDPQARPLFQEYIAQEGSREEQWARIKKAEAAHRNCFVYKCEQDAREAFAELRKEIAREGRIPKKALFEVVK